MRVRTRIRPGIYFDEHNFARACVVLEANAGHRWVLLGALDTRTRERILDPPSALPIETE